VTRDTGWLAPTRLLAALGAIALLFAIGFVLRRRTAEPAGEVESEDEDFALSAQAADDTLPG
jgi:hypothetical protein